MAPEPTARAFPEQLLPELRAGRERLAERGRDDDARRRRASDDLDRVVRDDLGPLAAHALRPALDAGGNEAHVGVALEGYSSLWARYGRSGAGEWVRLSWSERDPALVWSVAPVGVSPREGELACDRGDALALAEQRGKDGGDEVPTLAVRRGPGELLLEALAAWLEHPESPRRGGELLERLGEFAHWAADHGIGHKAG